MDSDNDGCPDALEAAGNFNTTNLNPNGSLSGSVDANGVPTQASGGQATTTAVTTATQVAITTQPTNQSTYQ